MNEIRIMNVEKAYGDKEVLKDINLSIRLGEKVGLIGDNGCGKSTLLNIICGEEKSDKGSVLMDDYLTIEYLRQEDEEKMAEQSIRQGLSGGERTKMRLNKILVSDSDLLLLDEPTNNLDDESITMLISQLKRYWGTVIVVSHDRYFLNRVVDKIIEIGRSDVYEFHGNYDEYMEFKKKAEADTLNRYFEGRKQEKKVEEAITKSKQWADKAHRDSRKKDSSGLTMGVKEKKRAKAKKLDKKVKNDIKRLEKMKMTSERPLKKEKQVYFEISNQRHHGKRVLEITDLVKFYGEKEIIKDSSLTILRGEKIALFGKNGCGKTTLIHMIAGLEPVDKGSIWISPSITPYIMSQSLTELPKNSNVLDYLETQMDDIRNLDMTKLHYLGLDAHNLSGKIGQMSYGERMKMKLAEFILNKAEFIILDEPTNHIDIKTRITLENALSDYNGTLLIASHDRYLLKRVCNKVIIFDDKKLVKVETSFADYI